MRVKAIWMRPASNERWGSIFCLLDTCELKTLGQERIYDGVDGKGNTRYIETGNPDWQNAFDKDDRFDFSKANYYLKHFGGICIKQW